MMKGKFIAYMAECKANGKIYIGITKNGHVKRQEGHFYAARKGSSHAFHRAIRKYGEVNFTFTALACAFSLEDLQYIERTLIEQFNCMVPNGYNLTSGGERVAGFWFSEETKAKMSEKSKGRGLGRSLSIETKRKLSKALQGHDISSETRAKISVTLTGRKMPEEERLRMVGRKLPPEQIAKISAANKGKVRSEEARQRYSKAAIERQRKRNEKRIAFNASAITGLM